MVECVCPKVPGKLRIAIFHTRHKISLSLKNLLIRIVYTVLTLHTNALSCCLYSVCTIFQLYFSVCVFVPLIFVQHSLFHVPISLICLFSIIYLMSQVLSRLVLVSSYLFIFIVFIIILFPYQTGFLVWYLNIFLCLTTDCNTLLVHSPTYENDNF